MAAKCTRGRRSTPGLSVATWATQDDRFPGQESIHFRLLLAEIVSDAVCAKMMSRNVDDTPEDYEDADWDLYYSEYSGYMTLFLPIAHQLQSPSGS